MPETKKALPAWLLPTPARRDEPQPGPPLREFTLRLMRGEDLNREDAARLLDALLDETATDAQIGAALVALAVKGETIEELAGMAAAMRQRAVRISTRHARFIDTAGTGSSAAKTFNVSTAAAFVIAGAGLPVAKHGSRAATSRSGSADVLSALGVNVSASSGLMQECLDEVGVCFMFAPLYHKATARVAGVRRELGVHTTFNLLGPLSNPAGAPRQIVGVWHPALVEPIARTLGLLGAERAWVVHGRDGLDEVTLSDKTIVAEWNRGSLRVFEVGAEDFGLRVAPLDNLRGGDAADNARIIQSVLSGERCDEARSLVVVNAAAALIVGGAADDFQEAAALAQRSIQSGAAENALEELKRRTNS